MGFRDEPRDIVNWSMHQFITGRTSGSLTNDSIRAKFADWAESGISADLAADLFEAVVQMAQDAFEAGKEARGDNYRHALWDLQRLNDNRLDSLIVQRFIDAHKDEAGIAEMTSYSMSTKIEDEG